MKYVPYALAAIVVILLDQLTKWWVLLRFDDFERWPVIPHFFDLILVYNTGAAFSFLAHHSGWQKYFLIGLAFVICGWLAYAIVKDEFGRWGKWAAALIIGGAMGNVIDRFVHGKVVDFLLFYWRDWSYPAFNVADSFICVGAVLLILDSLIHKKQG